MNARQWFQMQSFAGRLAPQEDNSVNDKMQREIEELGETIIDGRVAEADVERPVKAVFPDDEEERRNG